MILGAAMKFVKPCAVSTVALRIQQATSFEHEHLAKQKVAGVSITQRLLCQRQEVRAGGWALQVRHYRSRW
jgi:hypothetical protein